MSTTLWVEIGIVWGMFIGVIIYCTFFDKPEDDE